MLYPNQKIQLLRDAKIQFNTDINSSGTSSLIVTLPSVNPTSGIVSTESTDYTISVTIIHINEVIGAYIFVADAEGIADYAFTLPNVDDSTLMIDNGSEQYRNLEEYLKTKYSKRGDLLEELVFIIKSFTIIR